MSLKCSVRPSRPVGAIPFAMQATRTQGEDMSNVSDLAAPVTGGVDTHAEVNVAAMVDQVGRVLGTEQFPTTTAGHRAALAWMRGHGRLVMVGVEGTG